MYHLLGFPWPRRRVIGALAAAAQIACLCAGPARAGTSTANQCWSQSALAYRPGDLLIQKNVAAARVRPPQAQTSSFQTTAVPLRGLTGAIRRVDLPAGSKKLVAITFDLCEQPHEIAGYQGDIVDFLRANHVKATFFAGGKWLLTHSERAQQLMSDPLFEIGNHSWEHRNLRTLSGSALVQEIAAPERAYEKVRGELAVRHCRRPDDQVFAEERAPDSAPLFRFPYGACDAKSLQAVADAGLSAIQWDVSAGDPWPGMTAPLMVKAVLSHVRPGSIVIFHANGRGWHTSEALPEIIGRLKEHGFEFATVSELLRAGQPVMESRCYDVKPGDTDKYDLIGHRHDAHDGGPVAPFGQKTHPPFGAPDDQPQGGWTVWTEPR